MSRIFALLLILVSVAHADECENLYMKSCVRQGTYDDGTGRAQWIPFKEVVAAMEKNLRPKFQARFLALISDPAKAKLRISAMSYYKLNKTPACREILSEECDRAVADALTTFSLNYLVPRRDPNDYGLPKYKPPSVRSLVKAAMIDDNADWEATVRELSGEVEDAMRDPKLNTFIEGDIFPELQRRVIEKLRQLVPDASVRDKLIEKISKLMVGFSSCYDDKKHDGKLAGMLVSNAKYKNAQLKVNICPGLLLENNSLFAISQTIVHEIGHSIDPCEIAEPVNTDVYFAYPKGVGKKTIETAFPVPGILACLRSKASVEARHKGSWWPFHRFDVCDPDQLSESFADWLSHEIVPDFIASRYRLTTEQYRIGYANEFRFFCNYPKGKWNEHPSAETRINRLLLVNPKVRRQMGCRDKSKSHEYCGVETQAVPTAPASETPIDAGVPR